MTKLFTISNGVFNSTFSSSSFRYNSGPKFTLGGSALSGRSLAEKKFDIRPSTFLYLYNCKVSASYLHYHAACGELSL